MNAKEIAELRRRWSGGRQNANWLRGCYVGEKREIVSLFRLPPVALPEEECEKYLSLLRKTLSGVPGSNLIDVDFANEQVGVSDEHRLLTALREDGLEDDDLAQTFFQRVIDGWTGEGSFLILLSRDAYDVPFRRGEGGAGDEAFTYLLCAVCPVKLTRPALTYCAEDNLFHPGEAEWTVGAPEAGFLFPAFDERAANIYRGLCYVRDPQRGYADFVKAVFGQEPPMPAPEQRETFRAVLEETLAEECSLEVVQSVHEQLCEQLAEQKQDRGAPPATVSAPQVRRALEACGVPPERVEAFEERYRERLGGETQVSAVNAMDTRQFEVRTPSVVIRVDPAHSDLVETRVINGARYILIRAEEGVEVNGVSVQIRN